MLSVLRRRASAFKDFAHSIRINAHPWRLLTAILLARTGISRKIVIQRDGYRLRFFPATLPIQMWTDKTARTDDEIVFKSLLNPGDTVVDVGANVGSLTLVAYNAVSPTGHVIALEAHPRTFDWLKHNLQLNHVDERRVVALNCAAGERAIKVDFSSYALDDVNRIVEPGTGLTVDMVQLDSVLTDYPSITLLKIDVEGYEYFVLQGATQTLTRVRYVYFEHLESQYRRYNIRGEEMVCFLQDAGFEIYERVGANWKPYVWKESDLSIRNLLATRMPPDNLQIKHAGDDG